MKRLLTLLMTALLVFAVGCPSPTSSGEDDIAVTGFSLDFDQVGLALDKGDTFAITATVSPDNATNKNVVWTSRNDAVVTVDNGLLSAVNPGDATILVYPADAPSLVKAISVHVDEEKIDVTGVELDKTDLPLKETATAQLAAIITPANATNKAVSWSSDDTAVATVNSSGLVTAVAEGNAKITATTADNNRVAICEVTVEALITAITVTDVTISPASPSVDLKTDTTVQLTAAVLPADATNKAVTWKSGDADVAVVNATGQVTALAEGTAEITVTAADGGLSDTVTVTVTDTSVAVTGVTLDESSADLKVGGSVNLTAAVAPANADNQYVTWSTSNAAVATVDNGLVAAAAAGTATITVTTVDGEFTAACTVTVTENATVADLIAAGTDALKRESYDEARDFFDDAYALDNTNATAALWKALAELATALIDEEMQTIAANAGLTNYPSTLNELLTGDFLTEVSVQTGTSSTETWMNGELVESSNEPYFEYFPQITIPTPEGYDMLNLISAIDDGEEEGLNILSIDEYMLSLFYNLAQAYPSGITTPIASFVGVLTEATDSAAAVLATVDTSGSISLTPDILGFTEDELTIWPMENGTDYIPQVVGAAEFKAVNGAIKVLNSLFTYALSVSYDMDTQVYTDHFLNFYTTGSTDWDSLPAHPMKEMLVEQSNTALADSRAYLSSGLADLIAAADDIQSRTDADSPFTVSAAEQPEGIWAEILNGAEIADVFLTKLKASLDDDGTTVCIPIELSDSSDFDDLTGTVISQEGMPEVIEVNISKLFDQSILDPANLLEMDENREPVIYTFGADGSADPAKLTSQANITEGVYGFKGQDYTLGGLLVIDEADITDVLNGQMGDSSMVVFDATTGENDFYVQAPIEAPLVWSALNELDAVATYEGDTIYGAGSFYWAPLRNFQIFIIDGEEEGIPLQ